MSLPYFPMFPSDFEAKTSHLSILEDGAYNRLLRICWMTPGCSMPDDEAWIMRRVRAFTDADKEAVRAVLAEFFKTAGGRVSNARLTKEWLAANEAHEKRKNAGAKGGKAKSLKTQETEPSNATAMPKQPEPEPLRETGKPVSGAPRKAPDFVPQDFEAFWAAYLHRNGKKTKRQDAERAFAKAIRSGATVAQIAAGVEAMRRDPDVIRGYARDPTSWLNQRGWTDEIPENPQVIPYDNRTPRQANGSPAGPDATARRIAFAAATPRAPRPDWN